MLDYELKQIDKNIKYIAGFDEAGRGCCAGPLVVASVIMPREYINDKINDSKKLSFKKRSELFNEIINNAYDYSIEIISNKTVDELNPKKASKIGMYNCLQKLRIRPNLLITDFEKIDQNDIPQINLVKGDVLSFNVACASILAKVTRDNIMIREHNNYPNYNFLNNKGYNTKEHQKAIENYGVCALHRLSYKNVDEAIKIYNKNLQKASIK